MAIKDNNDWSSIFKTKPDKSTPQTPEYKDPTDWSSVFSKPAIPEQPKADDSFFPRFGQFVEGTKDIARSTAQGVGVISDPRNEIELQRSLKANVAAGPDNWITRRLEKSIKQKEVSTEEAEGSLFKRLQESVPSGYDLSTSLATSESLEADPALLQDQTFVEKVIRTTPQVIGQAVISIASAGTLSIPFMGLQILGGAYAENIADGATHEDAKNMAMLSTILQTPLEQIGIGFATKFIPVKKQIFKKLIDIGSAGFVEGLTEFLQEYPGAWTNLMAKNPNETALKNLLTVLKDPKTFMDALEAGAIGAILGSGVQVVVPSQKLDTGDLGTNPEPEKTGAIKDKVDAKDLYNQVVDRMVEEETAVAEAGVIPEGGAIPEQPVAPISTTSEAAGGMDIDGISDIAKLIVEEGIVEDVDVKGDVVKRVAAGEQDVIKGLREYETEYLAKPEGRPDWAMKTEAISKPVTEVEIMHSDILKKDAETAYRLELGHDVAAESANVKDYRAFMDKRHDASRTYGADFVKQVDNKTLDPIQKLYKKIAEKLYNRPVFYVEYNQKVKDDPGSPLKAARGVRMPVSGAIIINKGDPIRNTGTLFHELTHDMNKLAPELWRNLADFVMHNAESESLKKHINTLKKHYGSDKDTITDEIVASFVGDLMMKKKPQHALLKKLESQNPSAFLKLMKFVEKALHKLYNFVSDFDSRESRVLSKDINRAIEFVTDTLAEYQKIGGKIHPAKGQTIESVQKVTPAFDLEAIEKKDKVWFSGMNKFMQESLPGKGGAKQLIQLIKSWHTKGRFKTEELEWSGLISMFEDAPADKVFTKKEIMDYLKENEVSIVEIHKSERAGGVVFDMPAAQQKRVLLSSSVTRAGWSPVYSDVDGQTVIAEIENRETGDKFSIDRAKGVFIDSGMSEEDADILSEDLDALIDIDDKIYEELDLKERPGDAQWTSDKLNIGGGHDYKEMLITLPKITPKFKSGHWKEEKNVVAFVRYDFRNVEGKKVLLIQELQSDWHQIGKKKGYTETIDVGFTSIDLENTTQENIDKYAGIVGEGVRYVAIDKDTGVMYAGSEVSAEEAIETAKINFVKPTEKRGVPDAPFKKTWSDLSMKRMVKLAAETGVDYIAWVPGEVIQERYDLSNHIRSVVYSEEGSSLTAYDMEGNEVLSETIYDLAEFDEYIGPELGQKLRDEIDNVQVGRDQQEITYDEENGGFVVYDENGEIGYDMGGDVLVFESKKEAQEHLDLAFAENERIYPQMSLNGIDLKAGGEWAENLYDEKLVNRTNSLFSKSKWGKPKVFKGEVPVPEFESMVQSVWMLPITQKMKDKIPGELIPKFDIETVPAPVRGSGDKAAISLISNIGRGINVVNIDNDDYGTQAIANSLGFIKEGDQYKFDERIPKDVDIITGMYQASWHVDLESKRGTEKLFSKVSEQFGQLERAGVGDRKQVQDPEKLKGYLNKSWVSYREAADATAKGDFLPTKNVLLRPKGVTSGKGRQVLIQISSDFRGEGASNIGDSYYEALYNKREGYFRPSNDFWELPEWMVRMAYFMPDADVYVIRNLKEAKKFLNQANYDNAFFSVLDTNKRFVKEVADTYTGKIIAGGYLPDGSYYEGMDNVTWVDDMPAAAKTMGIEFKNGVDYRHFKNTKTIPRLEMSKGCLHKCAFCSQDRVLTVSSPEDIDQQIKEYKAFDYEIVYLNDKTFGQAENYPDLVGIKEKIQKVNPNFKGFVIQTTATQYNKMSDEFLMDSGIVYLEIGVETFNDKMLSALHKPHREKHILEAAEKARRLNQVFVPNVMVGLATKDKDGKITLETASTYARTLKFLNDNKDIISHTNIGVLAAETGTELHAQLDAVESDQDEAMMERSWIKNQDLHDKFFTDLSKFGEDQLNSKEVAEYVKKSIIINTGKEPSSKLDVFKEMLPDVKVDAIGSEGSTLPAGKIQVTMDKESPAAGGTFSIDISDKTTMEKQITSKVDEFVSAKKDISKGLFPSTKKLLKIAQDIEPAVEGDRKSESFRYAHYGIFGIAEKAKGMKNVRKYLAKQTELNGLPVTPELVKNIGNVADRLYKDRKKANEFKKVVKMREALATGKLNPTDDKVKKEMKKLGVQPYTIRNTGDNYFIGERMRYGKFTKSEALFDVDREVTRETKLPYDNPITGKREYLVKQYDKDGNRLITGPIFSTDRKTRLEEIAKVVKKNIRYSNWYERWKKFLFQFVDKGVSEMKIKRIAAISGLLGAGKSPQNQQSIWAEVINQLEVGRRPTKVTGADFKKVMDIWEGKNDDILGRTDDEGIALIQAEFGRKIGPYLAAAIDPSSPNVLVLDRHMPKGWGYNMLANADNVQGSWNMHPSVESEIRRDILQSAENMNMTVAGVQAALWFDFRTPAADQSDIVNIAQIEPGRYVPYVFHKLTYPEETTGIHYKKTPMKPGDVVRGYVPGKGKFNSYSIQDIGERIERATKDWPYEPVVYMYTPGVHHEPIVKTGRKAYTFKFEPKEIYDGVQDPYDYMGLAREEHKKSPEASLTNIFINLVKKRQGYKGIRVNSPWKDQPWMLIFDEAVVEDFPEETNIGISDIIDNEEVGRDYMDERSSALHRDIKKMIGRKMYTEISIARAYHSIATFEGVTSMENEPGLGLKLDGPLRTQRALLAEVGIRKKQNKVYLTHSKRPELDYPVWMNVSEAKLFKFKAINKYNDNPELLSVDLKKAGLREFNIVTSPAGWVHIEQVVFGDEDFKSMTDIMDKFAEKGFMHNEVTDVHAEVLSTDNYLQALQDYWGETKGTERYEKAIKGQERFVKEVRTEAYQKRIAKGKPAKRKGRRDDDGSDRGLIPKFDLEVDENVEASLDRIGRKKVKLIDKFKEKANYKDGTFITASVDKLNPLAMAAGKESKAYMMHRGLPGIQSSINAMMEHGKLELEQSGVLTTKTINEGFIPWLRDLGTDGEKFFYWLIAKRDLNRSKRDKKYKTMFTKEERDNMFIWTGDKTAAGKPWQMVNKEFQGYNDSVLKLGIDSGLLDPAMVAQFKDQFYIPFFRIFENEESNAEFVKAPVNTKKIIAAQIKKLKGSRRQMGDPLENILANWSHIIKQSMTNLSRKEAFTTLSENKVLNEKGELVVEEVPWKDTVIFKPGGKKPNDYGGSDTVTFVYQNEGIEVLGFKDNGKTRFFKVNDPELFQALSLQSGARMPGWLAAILGAPKALLTFGATITPSFIIANATRDTLHTYTISKGFVPFIDTMKGFYKTLRKDKDFVEYMASGNAFVGSYVKADRPEAFGKYARKIIKKEGRGAIGRILDTPAKLWGFWETFTEASENATRLALYVNIKRQGGTQLEAAFSARDIMDFQKKGASPVVQYLTATVPFLNARIQGLHRMGQAMAENPKMYALKGASVAMASLALWAAFKDDDRYKELEEWEKFAYYHFWIGDKHFRIPKPFETGVIWSSAWTVAADVLTGNEETNHITGFISASLLDTFAFNPVPQTARPILEQYFNKNFFTGRAIVSEGLMYRKPEDRFYPWDHESAVVLGKALGVSPRRIQSLIRGYLAGFGLGIMAGADMMVRQFGDFPIRPETTIDSYPMIGRFVRSTPSRYTKYQTKFYDIFNELNMLNQTINIAVRDGRFVEAHELRKVSQRELMAFGKGKHVKRNLARIRKSVLGIWKNNQMSPKKKLEELNKLAVERQGYVKDFYDWYLENINP